MVSFIRACVLSLGVLLCLAGVTTQAKPKTYQITIESTPPGATVYLDKETKPAKRGAPRRHSKRAPR